MTVTRVLMITLMLLVQSTFSVEAEPALSTCRVKSLLPQVFYNSAVQPLLPDTCDDCASLTSGVYYGCKKAGGNDCYCAMQASIFCTSGQVNCAPCNVCLTWRDMAFGFCADEAPKAPPTRPGGN